MKIRIAFGHKNSSDNPMEEDDLSEKGDDYLFSQQPPESRANKLSARDKRIESNINPIKIRAFFWRLCLEDKADNCLFHGLTVQ